MIFALEVPLFTSASTPESTERVPEVSVVIVEAALTFKVPPESVPMPLPEPFKVTVPPAIVVIVVALAAVTVEAPETSPSPLPTGITIEPDE